MHADDIRRYRYRIVTPSGDTHAFSGKRTYEYLCAAAEANGEFVEQARESAAATMRTAIGIECNLMTDIRPDREYRIRIVDAAS